MMLKQSVEPRLSRHLKETLDEAHGRGTATKVEREKKEGVNQIEQVTIEGCMNDKRRSVRDEACL